MRVEVISLPEEKPVRRRKPETFTVSFRAGGRTLTDLERRAAKSGSSVHETAREIVTERLERRDEERLLDAAQEALEKAEATRREVRADIAELREDMARMLEVILLNTTGESETQIRAWIDDHLRERRKR